MAAHYDTFRDQLAIAHPAFGHALWEPDPGEKDPAVEIGDDPGEKNPAVEIGDVGFIIHGKFHRLFNALLPADDPSHEESNLPEHHEPLQPHMRNHISRGTLSANDIYSYGVKVVSGGLEALATA